MIKIALLGIAAVVLALQFRNGKSEYGTLISLAACCLIFYFGVGMLTAVLDGIDRILSYTAIDSEYLKILLKMLGITYAAEFAANLCKDAGYSAIGSQIELAGKFAVLAAGMPVVISVAEVIGNLLGK